MSTRQDLTPTSGSSEIKAMPVPWQMLTAAQQTLVDYKALNGLIFDKDAEGKNGIPMRRMTHEELGKALGLSRQRLYQIIDEIPNFWELVAERRSILFSQTRLSKIHETWYLKAVGGSWPHMEAWLRNFDPNFKDPKTKVEHEVGGGLADLLNRARSRRDEGAIDGEVIDPANPNT